MNLPKHKSVHPMYNVLIAMGRCHLSETLTLIQRPSAGMTCGQIPSNKQASSPLVHRRAFTNMNPVAIHAQSPEVQCPNCREAMRLMRHIYLTGVPNIYVFYCQRCQYVQTVKEEKAAA